MSSVNINIDEKKEKIRSLCSYIIFEVRYKEGLIMKSERKENITIWFTPRKIVGYEPRNLPIEIGFKTGDYIQSAIDWARENDFSLVKIKRKRYTDSI